MKTNEYNFVVKGFGRIGKIFLFILIMNFVFSPLAKATDIPAATAFGTLDASDGLVDGIYNVPDDLHILSTGSITGPGGLFGIKINVIGDLVIDIGGSINGNDTGASATGITIDINVGGDVILHGNGTTGASITSNQVAGSCSGGHGGNITLIAGGNFIMEDGSKITSDSRCTAGFIYIKAAGIVDIDGFVESHAALSGTGANQAPGGGPVTIIGGCSLNISDNGIVSSRGQDPGADLVHLEACAVIIYGLVQSTGVGHALPDDSITHVVPPYRPEKPATSAAGVEVWAGTIIINSIPPHQGEVKADLTTGEASVGWIDLFAQNDINIIGDSIGNFAVHANNGGNQNQGGFISVKSVGAIIDATGRAFQANGAFGGSGGVISLEANNNLALSGAEFDEATGVSNDGGTIILKSFNGDIVSTLAVVINVSAPSPGTVTRTACGVIGPATIIPGSVVPSDNFGPLYCGGSPAIFPEDSLPDCASNVTCNITGDNFCQGDSTELCAPTGMASYLWSTNETTQCITVDSAGTYTVTVTDASGCTSSCTAEITINTPPTCSITGDNFCQGDSTELCAPAGMDSYLWSTNETTQCVFVDAGGTYTVTVTDINGCTSSCTIEVTENNLPSCQITGNNFCQGDSTELCAPVGMTSYLWSTAEITQCITVDSAGTYTVTVTDANGCTSSCTTEVTLINPPTCSIAGSDTICPGDTTIFDGPPGMDTYEWSITGNGTINGATDSSSVEVIAGNSCGIQYTLTLTVTLNGCTATCTMDVHVIDVTPPQITCPVVSDVECPGTPSFGTATATDACDNSVQPTFSNVTTPGTCTQEFSVTRTWTATDDCTNSSTCSRTINVTDNNAPTITCPSVSDIECPGTPSFAPATANDVCDPSVIPTFSNVTTPSGVCPQEYSVTRTWTATDDCLNSSTCSRTINVTDNNAPTITCPTVTTPINCPGTPVFGSASASDVCDANVPVNYSTVTTPACGTTFSKTRTWTATDDCGNTSTCSRTIVVQDVTPPTITCPTNATVVCGAAIVWGTPTFGDACSTPSLSVDTTMDNRDTCGNGTLVRTWRATDACSNTNTCSKTITISDCGGVSLLKTTEGVVNPGMDWNFTLKDVTTNTVLASQNTLGDLNGILFENIGPLTASHKYLICENNIPAGWSVIVKADLNGDGTAESIVAGYNPDLNNVPPQNLGNLCFEFGFGTAIPLPVGNPLIGCKFVYWADNTFPGGDPRTPGYWKNWNCCTSGGQCAHAQSAGGCDSGYCIVEDVIFAPGPGITWCNNTTVGDNSPTLHINSCQMAVWILDQRDICASNHAKRASDAAYTLAMHLLAAELNMAVGAENCPTAQLAQAYGRQLLCSVNYDGCGDILKKATDPKYAKALCIKNCLEKYNTGNLCPSGTCVSCSGYPFREDQSFADFIVSDELITSFPNPATDNSTILFMVGEDAHAVLEVYSYNGAKVASLLDRKVHAGETVSVEFNTGSLSKGIYFCKLEMNGNVYTHKISVVK